MSVLADDLRRRIYGAVRGARVPLTREDIARHVGISPRLAAFHLDKLLTHGLLQSHYARPPGRGGPGAGRSAKYYEPSEVEIDISIPDRRYDLAGELLVDAVSSQRRGESARASAVRVAAARGHEIGRDAGAARRLRRPGAERTLATAEDTLREYGYEPYRDGNDDVALSNCPFDSLAKRNPELVCEMNRAFLDGILRGMGNDSVEAALECTPGDCCVTLRAPVRRSSAARSPSGTRGSSAGSRRARSGA